MILRVCGRACVRLKRLYDRLQYDDTRFAQNELERNRITQARTNVSNLSFARDPENALTAMCAPTSKLNMSMWTCGAAVSI